MGNRASNTTSKINQPYHTLVEDAVAVLKERPGSTQQDIFKLLESKYNGKIPVQIRKTLTVRLRSTIKKSQLEAKKARASTSRSSPSDAQPAASSRGTGAGGLRGRPPKKRLNACNNKRRAAAGTSTRKSSLATRKGGRRNARRRSRNRVKFAPGTKTQKTKSKKLYDKVRHPTPRP